MQFCCRYLRRKISTRIAVHPETPDVRQICSKRSFDGQAKKWRRELHLWDPVEDDDLLDPVMVSDITLVWLLLTKNRHPESLHPKALIGPLAQSRCHVVLCCCLSHAVLSMHNLVYVECIAIHKHLLISVLQAIFNVPICIK